MKWQPIRKTQAGMALFAVLFCVTLMALYLRNAYSPRGSWLSNYQTPNEHVEMKMLLMASGEGLLSRSYYDLKTKTRRKTSGLTCFRYTGNGRLLHFYESDGRYSHQGPLMANASIIGFARLEVRFSQTSQLNWPTRATFKKKMKADA